MTEETRNFERKMIEWLSDKDEDVVFAVTRGLNWDFAEDVLKWIVNRPSCDKAIARWVFSHCAPEWHLEQFGKEKKHPDEGFELFQSIVKNWQEGIYRNANLKFDDAEFDDTIDVYKSIVASDFDGLDPFSVPLDLFEPTKGLVPEKYLWQLVADDPKLKELLAGLGTHFQ